jgi:N-acetylmuramoyl-L-alanine amidase
MIARLSILCAAAALAGCGGEEPGRSVPIANVEEARPIALPPVLGPRDAALPLVVIDAGHGGRDPGAVAPGLSEKDVTLALASAIRDALLGSKRVRVAMTRADDRLVALEDRPEIARRLRADLFLSIHADAAPREGASGASLYTLSEVASDRDAAALAERENAGAEGGDAASGAVGQILFDLAQRESLETAADFAALLHREAAPLVPFRQDYRRFAALAVLRSSEVPSLLFECGYLTNPQDAAFLRSEEGRRRIAESVRRAVDAHFARRGRVEGRGGMG